MEFTERIAIDSGLLSYPGVDRAQENEVIRCESMQTRIMKRELASSDGLCESLMITPKDADKKNGFVHCRTLLRF